MLSVVSVASFVRFAAYEPSDTIHDSAFRTTSIQVACAVSVADQNWQFDLTPDGSAIRVVAKQKREVD